MSTTPFLTFLRNKSFRCCAVGSCVSSSLCSLKFRNLSLALLRLKA